MMKLENVFCERCEDYISDVTDQNLVLDRPQTREEPAEYKVVCNHCLERDENAKARAEDRKIVEAEDNAD